MRYNGYPFVAVVGQERLKRALLLAAIHPAVSGVLVSGEKGTAKSTLVRALPELLTDRRLVELPLSVTADRLVGSIDVERVVKDGSRAAMKGILSEADGQILYVDEINLLPEHVVNVLLEVSASGVNRVEREGVSAEYPARFSLVGSMNPEEGQLRPHLLDRFGLYVASEGERDAEARAEIIRRRLAYEADPIAFREACSEETAVLRERLALASARLQGISVSEDALRFATELSHSGRCAGHRAELILIETARAIAALDGAEAVSDSALREAATYVLPHRVRESVELPPDTDEASEMTPPESTERAEDSEEDRDNRQPPPPTENDPDDDSARERAVSGETAAIDHIPLELRFNELKSASGSGKRAKVRSGSARGRYVRYRIPRGKATDIAVDATLRQATLHPKDEGESLAVTVRGSDLRVKIREQRCGATILFCVDASASMGVGKRMAAVKGAVISLLTDAYQKRDAVGIVTFRGDGSQLVLPMTRSVDLAKKQLSTLKTGGKTPLSAGLDRSYEILKAARARDKEILPFVVLLSDGKANRSASEVDPFEDAVRAAQRIVGDRMNLLVLDCEFGRIRFEFAKKLAERSGADYIRLSELSGEEIERRVKAHMGT